MSPFRLFLVLGLLVAAPASLSAQAAGPISAADREAIEATISAQMAAFARDDGETAFGFADPSIRARFVDADAFMSMVRSGYRPVYRPRAVRFLSLEGAANEALQNVLVVGPDGSPYYAYYSMRRQGGGGWRVGSVILVRAEAEET